MAMARSSLGTSMAMVRRLCTAVRELPGKGRGVIATAAIAPNTQLLQVAPAAQVLKKTVAASNTPHCAACMRPTAWGVCGEACEDEFVARGYDLLERVDLSPLHRLHEMEGRKFPLLIAQLLAALLADVKRTRTLPESWPPLELCFTELHEEAEVQVETEHTQLLRAFADAGLANEPTLALFMPLARYRRLLGAAQLNAFELSLSHGAKVSALLPGLASCFNHRLGLGLVRVLKARARVRARARARAKAGG